MAVDPMKKACRKRYERLRAEGPLVPYLGAYFDHLADQGYAQVTFWKKTFLISEFSRWLNKEGISVDRITADHERVFLHFRVLQGVAKTGEGPTLEALAVWLQERGVLTRDAVDPAETSEMDRVLRDYTAYLKHDRGLLATTIKNYAGLVRRFLTDADGVSLATLRARQITDFFRRNAPKDRTFADAMDLLHAGVEQTVIALWLGHESIETTQIYLDADLDLKERILAKTIPFDSKPGKFRPDDQLLTFLNQL